MKFLQFLIAFFIFISPVIAQQNHFIYIQTENKQPFYVRLGDKVLSSSSVGYIVIPKLQNGSYELNIGFPKNEWPQQKINITVNNNDAGFALKNFDPKGWGLFNMQTLDIIMSSDNPVNNNANTSSKSDGFADVLADVVNTPSIKDKSATKQAGDTKQPAATQTVPVEENKTPVVVKEETPAKELIKPAVKLSTTLDNNGRSIVYIDRFENNTDTVRIFIPYKDTVEKEDNTGNTQLTEKVKKEDSAPVKKDEPVIVKETKEQPKEDKKFLDIAVPNPNTKADATPAETTKEQTTVPANKEPASSKPAGLTINSDCKSNASEDDFLKLRKKMAAQKTDENMILMARKSFIVKCYSTEQINNLSSLFLKDEGRYNFFDASYPHVSDTQNFGTLIGRLTDEYYINRFKAMIRH